MLIIFSSNATGDITMFGDDAERLIKMMGHSGTIPSAIAAKDIPDVLARLKTAVESQNDEEPNDEQGTDNEESDDEPRVGIAGRAFPLIEMLTRAAKEECSVMWRQK